MSTMNRRSFLKISALAGGGVMFAFPTGLLGQDLGTQVGDVELNAYIKIAADGTITIYAPTPEMGQGVRTSLPMIIAEEMGAKWEDVKVVQSEVDSARYGAQFAGGSTAIPMRYQELRIVGASAREMLIGAAAETMELPRTELKARNSEVVHISGRKLTFGQLASLAAKQPVPDRNNLDFRDPDDYTIIGTSIPSVDNLVLVTGIAQFGLDTQVPDMRHAVYFKCPTIGGIARSANLDEIKRLPGVEDAFIVEGNGNVAQLFSGVAIVGDSTWAVFNARSRLKVDWDTSAASKDSWKSLIARAGELRKQPGGSKSVIDKGEVDAAFAANAERTIEADYDYPFVAHFCMEPMNCTAHYRKAAAGGKDSLEVWAPTQAPGGVAPTAKALFGVDADQVTVHQTRLGGGFGRRFSTEFVCEAIAVSKQVGKPIKLTWTREDDVHHDYFRTGGFQKLKGAVDQNGKLAAWDQHVIGMERDGRAVSGAGFGAAEFPLLNLNTVRGSLSMLDIDTPCGPWRAPGANTHAFVVQGFIHELATLAKRDHLAFLLEMMGDPRWFKEGDIGSLNTGRAADVIRLAAKEAGWGRAMPAGRGLGLSFHFSHAAHVAEVAEVSMDSNRKLRLHKVTVAVDVGPIINRSGAIGQVQGSVIDGYSTMVGQLITMENGQIEQSNLHDYPVLRIAAAPEVDVHFIESKNAPTGLGEPALPPLAPAVANAIFAASGIRVRAMPLSVYGITV